MTLPSSCYFCGQAAHVEEGRNSYLVDCTQCEICYEMDHTAWATKSKSVPALLEYVREQRRHGYTRPCLALEHVQGDPLSQFKPQPV